jgi:hypothetical protein
MLNIIINLSLCHYFPLSSHCSQAQNSTNERPANLTSFRVKVVFLVGISPHDISDEQQYEINYENDAYGECNCIWFIHALERQLTIYCVTL